MVNLSYTGNLVWIIAMSLGEIKLWLRSQRSIERDLCPHPAIRKELQ